jgi:hypothetical protein
MLALEPRGEALRQREVRLMAKNVDRYIWFKNDSSIDKLPALAAQIRHGRMS